MTDSVQTKSEQDFRGSTDKLDALRKLTVNRESPDVGPARIRKPELSLGWLAWQGGLFFGGAALALAAVSRLPTAKPETLRDAKAASGQQIIASPASSVVAAGYVVARRQATVAAEITGRIIHLPVQEGEFVKKGQVLATLDSALARADLAAQEYRQSGAVAEIAATDARLANARSVRARMEALKPKGFVTVAALNSAVSDEQALAAQAAQARTSLRSESATVQGLREKVGRSVVRAPFDGVVIERNAQVGEIISPTSAGGGFTRTGLCTIVDMKSLELEVDVAEAYLARVRPGQAAWATLDAYPETKLPAEVVAIIPTVSREKGTVKVRLVLLKIDSRIMPNMSVKVVIGVGNQSSSRF